MDVGAYRWYADGKEAGRVSLGPAVASPPKKGRGLYFVGFADNGTTSPSISPGLLCSESLESAAWRDAGLPHIVYKMAYGAGVYVALTDDGLYYSFAGEGDWKKSNSSAICNSVVFLEGRFFAPRASGTIYVSYNGIRWKSTNAPSKTWLGICSGAGKFMALASDKYVYFSNDGLTWTKGPLANVGSTGIGGCAYDPSSRTWAVCGPVGTDAYVNSVRILKDGGNEFEDDVAYSGTPQGRSPVQMTSFNGLFITACDYNENQSGSVSGITITYKPGLKNASSFVHLLNSKYQPNRANVRYYTVFCLAEGPMFRRLVVGCTPGSGAKGEIYWSEDGVRWNYLAPPIPAAARMQCVGFG